MAVQDDYLTQPVPVKRGSRTGRAILLVAVLAFVLGAFAVAWMARQGTLDKFLPSPSRSELAVDQLAGAPAAPPGVTAAVPTLATGSTPATGNIGQAVGGIETRLALLEDRLSRIDARADAASGNAARAEALLIAAAARRKIERGAPLGFLEDQLKLRFGGAQPMAVQTLIDAAKQPVTLADLAGQLDADAPRLIRAPDAGGGWTRIQRELTELFVVRREPAAPTAPEDRLARARLLLITGKVDEAIAEVEQIPNPTGATGWIDAARRYSAAQRALDLIETAALLEPERLQDAVGQTVTQPSPAAAPAAEAVPAP